MKVIFIHGPAASGKHTIGTLVSKELGLPLFHNHLTIDLAKTLFAFGTKEFSQLRAEIWRSSFRIATETAQSFIFTYNPERTVDPTLLAGLHSIVEESGGEMLYVALQCSQTEILNRIENESRTRFNKLTSRSLFLELTAQGAFESVPLPSPWMEINTESLSATQAAEAIISGIRPPART